MRLGVTGYGVVGSATADVLRRLGHLVFVQDVASDRLEAASADGFGSRDGAERIEADFVCVPETNAAEALAALPLGPVAVLRSTVQPGTTDQLAKELARPVLFMPEFLREATAKWDTLNPHLILIGTHDRELGEWLSSIFASLMTKTVSRRLPKWSSCR